LGLVPAIAQAGYIDSQLKNSPAYKRVLYVAQNGCTIGAAQWTETMMAFGGSQGDAIWHLTKMRTGNELVIDSPSQTLTLTGVFGC
jgi:hypothetical protein